MRIESLSEWGYASCPMCHEPSFDWWGAVIIPLLMTVFVGGGIGLFLSRMLIYQQTLAAAVGAIMEAALIVDTGDFKTAQLASRSVHSKVRGSSMMLLLSGHLEAAAGMTRICNAMEDQIKSILEEERAHFKGELSEAAQIARISDRVGLVFMGKGAEVARLKTPFWRYFDWRQRAPSKDYRPNIKSRRH